MNEQETRQRLLEAAGEVFADQGFAGATIRDICRRAEANVAAVNYHFRDKESLYREVHRYAQVCAIQFPAEIFKPGQAAPRERLESFIRALLGRLLDQGRPSWHLRLMAREMVDPTPALSMVVEESIRPHHALLVSIIRDYLPDSDEPTARACAASVIGQCLHYHHARAMIARLHPDQKFDAEEAARLVKHITAFSDAGLRCLARQQSRAPSSRRAAVKG